VPHHRGLEFVPDHRGFLLEYKAVGYHK
jgi:hypothetical protein